MSNSRQNQWNIEIINPLQLKNWDEFIVDFPTATIFHSSFWANVLNKSYSYSPQYFTLYHQHLLEFMLPVMDISNRITGKRGVSLPFTDFCEPLIKDSLETTKIAEQIIETAALLNWKNIEFRGGNRLFQKQTHSLQYYRHFLLMDDEAKLLKNLKDSYRRNIRKAERNGIIVKIDNSPDSLEEFYKLNCITRKKHGLPPQPIKFFRNVFDQIIKNRYGCIFQARFQNKIIASAIYFHFNNTAIYKYGASDIAHLPLRANNLLMWEAIKYFSAQNYQLLDFGKTEFINEGLRRFKKGWGSTEEIFHYYKYNFLTQKFETDRNKETGWYNNVFKNMPTPVLKLIGKILYRYVG